MMNAIHRTGPRNPSGPEACQLMLELARGAGVLGSATLVRNLSG
jgi:hypothetical protein